MLSAVAHSEFSQIVASPTLPYSLIFNGRENGWSDAIGIYFLRNNINHNSFHTHTYKLHLFLLLLANVVSGDYESKALAANFHLRSSSAPLEHFAADKRNGWLVTRRVAVNFWPKPSWSFSGHAQQRCAADHAQQISEL